MRKKILTIILLTFGLCLFFAYSSTVKAAEPTYNPDDGFIMNGSQKCFFANGTDITINTPANNSDGATIVWDNGAKSVDVPSDISIFGGSHNDSLTYDTKITMQGGTVKNIFGGGLHESYVGTSSIIVNGGKVTGSIVGGGANVFSGSDNCAPKAGNSKGSSTRVVRANVTINGGTAYMVFGGGEGLSYTGSTNVTINGGTFQYVTAGGSNGYTGNASINVTNGNIDVLQSVNRGEIVSANVQVSGGTIKKLYVGAEDDPTVTGTIEAVKLDITGSAVVENLYMGNSGGQRIGTNGNNTNVDVDIHNGASVHIADPSQFADGIITEFVYVIINTNKYELEKGKTLADLTELQAIKNSAGKTFNGFVKKGTKEVFAETTPINDDIELEILYKVEKPAIDETPKTGNDEKFDTIILFVLISLSTGIIATSKIKE